jgi:hypothetical protein
LEANALAQVLSTHVVPFQKQSAPELFLTQAAAIVAAPQVVLVTQPPPYLVVQVDTKSLQA